MCEYISWDIIMNEVIRGKVRVNCITNKLKKKWDW